MESGLEKKYTDSHQEITQRLSADTRQENQDGYKPGCISLGESQVWDCAFTILHVYAGVVHSPDHLSWNILHCAEDFSLRDRQIPNSRLHQGLVVFHRCSGECQTLNVCAISANNPTPSRPLKHLCLGKPWFKAHISASHCLTWGSLTGVGGLRKLCGYHVRPCAMGYCSRQIQAGDLGEIFHWTAAATCPQGGQFSSGWTESNLVTIMGNYNR